MIQFLHPTLMDSLKKAIVDQHARMEALPFITALASGRLPLVSYIGLLRAMSVIQGTLEHELAQRDSGDLRFVLPDRPSRLVHLRKDLSIFDQQLIPDIAEALNHTRKIAEQIRLYRVERPTDLLGIVYVLEGTTLGNAVHLRDVIHAVGNLTSGRAYYYEGYGKNTARYWQEFGNAMNSLPLDQNDRKRLIQVALAFFSQLESLFSALYPVENATMIFTAGMLNPEAGDHAVPSDALEIAAAVAAAKKCCEEFPYFDERYHDRGRGFAKSDAAWLATLADLPEAQLLSQVEWLGRVLGNRGMPRITLERQLELLYLELSAAVPAKIERYTGLLEAAGKLKGERLNCIPEQVFADLTRAFKQATNNQLQGRLKGTGSLIISAVCDQSLGIAEAVNSLLPWLTDEKRFYPEWIVAVKQTMGLAFDSVKDKKIGSSC